MSITRQVMVVVVGLTISLHVAAERATYKVGKFSEDYRATVTVDGDATGSSGVISVFDAHTGKRLVRVAADSLPFDLRDGEVPANIKELPYGEQSVLIYEDFNFDGKPDLAIMDGQKSCYGGPSFQIYLASEQGFRRNPDFTRLAQEYCGMFQVDAKARQLHVMTKSGCCWHLFETLDVVANRPEVVESIIDETVVPAPSYRRNTVTRGRKSRETYHLGYGTTDEAALADNLREVLSFRLKDHPEKQVSVFADGAGLDYALLRGQEAEVEFSFALDVGGVRGARAGREMAEMPRFAFDERAGVLMFRNGNTTYLVHDQPGKLGVTVRVGKKETFIEGDGASRRGGLQRLQEAAFQALENVDRRAIE